MCVGVCEGCVSGGEEVRGKEKSRDSSSTLSLLGWDGGISANTRSENFVVCFESLCVRESVLWGKRVKKDR